MKKEAKKWFFEEKIQAPKRDADIRDVVEESLCKYIPKFLPSVVKSALEPYMPLLEEIKKLREDTNGLFEWLNQEAAQSAKVGQSVPASHQVVGKSSTNQTPLGQTDPIQVVSQVGRSIQIDHDEYRHRHSRDDQKPRHYRDTRGIRQSPDSLSNVSQRGRYESSSDSDE